MWRFRYIFFLVSFFFCITGFAQYRDYASYNRLGLQAGATFGGIHTNNFKTSDKFGFTAGFGTRANVYNDLIVMYGVNFYQFVTGVSVKENSLAPSEEIDFKDLGVQINLFVGQKIIGEHLGIEIGPVLQINGKWQPDKAYENYFIEGYPVRAKDLEDISKVNFNLAANLSGGFRDFKVWLQYQYGVTNTFKDLKTEDLKKIFPNATDLVGHTGLATAGIVFYL